MRMGPRAGTPGTGGVQTVGVPADNPLVATVKAGIPTGGYVGRFGNAVFYASGGRTIMREVGEAVNPRTPEQQAGRRAFGDVAKGWGRLDDDAADAWDALARREGTTGYLLYMSLTRRWLRVHPGGTPPLLPPAGPFFGDAVVLSIGDFGLSKEARASAIPDPRS